jgi:hypothetical protein
MGCIIPILAVFMPRIALLIIFFFTDWLSRAYSTLLWPLLGFLLMPYTTLAWMAAMLYNHHEMSGFWIVVLVVAVIFDLGGQGHSARYRK